MKLDLSCPIEVRGYSMRRGDGCAEATVRLYNLSDRRIAAFEAVAKWHDSTSGLSLATPFVAERLRVGRNLHVFAQPFARYFHSGTS